MFQTETRLRRIEPITKVHGPMATDVRRPQRLQELLATGEFFYFIFDHRHRTAAIRCGHNGILFGVDRYELRQPFFSRWIHPEDLPRVMDFDEVFRDFQERLPIKKRRLYKARYDCRVRLVCGQYHRFLHRCKPIRFDGNGRLILSLVVMTNIERIKTTDKMTLSFLGSEGEPSFYDVATSARKIQERLNLTKREYEVLMHLSKNRSTREIAATMFISKHTVANHRKNIMRKTETHSILELVMKAKSKGWV